MFLHFDHENFMYFSLVLGGAPCDSKCLPPDRGDTPFFQKALFACSAVKKKCGDFSPHFEGFFQMYLDILNMETGILRRREGPPNSLLHIHIPF